ncbi:MAG: hypothetical protein ABIO70_20265 [Pseudomonadota bacterium]
MAGREPAFQQRRRWHEGWWWLALTMAGLFLAVVLARWIAEGAPTESASPVVRSVRPEAFAIAPAWKRSAPEARGALTIVARSWENEPVRDLELAVGPLTGRTDWQGEARFQGLEYGLQPVRLPEGWFGRLPGSESPALEVDLQGSDQLVTLLVDRDCTGPWQVLDPDGQPVVGAAVFGPAGQRVETDGLGRTEPALRLCGPNDLWVWIPRGDGHFDKYQDITADAAVAAPAEVRLPELRRAEIAVVDPEGAPIEAEVRGVQIHRVTPLGEGLYEVAAPVPLLGCAVSAEGWSRQEVALPLDGRRVHVTLRPIREVRVEARCDGACPEDLRCGRADCIRSGSTYTCTCPAEVAALVASRACDGSSADTVVPEGVTRLEWDLRCGTASVVGQWRGRTPCSAGVEGPQYRAGTCTPDGSFTVEGLMEGDYLLFLDDSTPGQAHFWGGEAQQATRRVHLDPGQRLDLGLVEPDAGCIEGRIVADQPVAGLLLQAPGRRRQTTLGADGAFMLCDLPLDEPAVLNLLAPGAPIATTEVLPGDDLTLRLSFHSDGTASLDPE